MRYTLKSILTGVNNLEDGKVATPILGYELIDNETGLVEITGRLDAYIKVQKFGATNCIAKNRFSEKYVCGQQPLITYLKPNDGTKVNQYLKPII